MILYIHTFQYWLILYIYDVFTNEFMPRLYPVYMGPNRCNNDSMQDGGFLECGYPKMMLSNGKSHLEMDMITGGTSILGNLHINIYIYIYPIETQKKELRDISVHQIHIRKTRRRSHEHPMTREWENPSTAQAIQGPSLKRLPIYIPLISIHCPIMSIINIWSTLCSFHMAMDKLSTNYR